MSRYKQLCEALAKKRQHDQDRFNRCAQLAKNLARTLRVDLGVGESDPEKTVMFRPSNSEEVGFVPVEMALGTSRDGYHLSMILKLKDPKHSPEHRIGFKLRFQEKGGSVYGVHIHSDMPELTIDLADESSYSLFSDAIYNRVMSHFNTDGEDDLDIQPTGVPN